MEKLSHNPVLQDIAISLVCNEIKQHIKRAGIGQLSTDLTELMDVLRNKDIVSYTVVTDSNIEESVLQLPNRPKGLTEVAIETFDNITYREKYCKDEEHVIGKIQLIFPIIAFI